MRVATQFVSDTQHLAEHHDDLLFFVYSADLPPGPPRAPFMVRRRSQQLPPELQLSGDAFGTVDWSRTVLLNLVLQARYQLMVVACRCACSSRVRARQGVCVDEGGASARDWVTVR